MDPVSHLVFDVESVADGRLIAGVKYPEESLTPEEAIAGAVEGVADLSEALIAGTLPPESEQDEVYLILVGSLTIEEVDAIFARVTSLLAALVEPQQVELAFFRPDDWQSRISQTGDFWAETLTGPLVRFVPAGEA